MNRMGRSASSLGFDDATRQTREAPERLLLSTEPQSLPSPTNEEPQPDLSNQVKEPAEHKHMNVRLSQSTRRHMMAKRESLPELFPNADAPISPSQTPLSPARTSSPSIPTAAPTTAPAAATMSSSSLTHSNSSSSTLTPYTPSSPSANGAGAGAGASASAGATTSKRPPVRSGRAASSNDENPGTSRPPRMQSSAVPSGGEGDLRNRKAINPADAFAVDASELEPLSAPVDVVIKKFNELLKRGDAQEQWTEKCEALLLIRRYAVTGPGSFDPKDLHMVLLALNNEVKNLRSSVARLALTTFCDFFRCLGRTMDMDLELTVTTLLSKAAAEQSNVFIREDVEKTLEAMVQSVTPQKAMAALLANISHKHILVRRIAAQFLNDVVSAPGGPSRLLKTKEGDTLVIATSNLVQDQSAENRYLGKKICMALMACDDFEKMCDRLLSGNASRTMKQTIEALNTKGIGDVPASMGGRAGAETTRAKKSARPRPGSKVMSSPARDDSEAVAKLVSSLASSDWRVRDEAVDDVVAIAGQDADVTPEVMYAFIPRLGDANSKVMAHAFQALSSLLDGAAAARVLPVCDFTITELLPAVVMSLSSKNVAAREYGDSILKRLAEALPVSFMTSASKSALSGATGVKEALMIHLTKLVPIAYQIAPKQVAKVVIPLARDAAGDAKISRGACEGLARALYDVLGDALFDRANDPLRTILA